MIGWRVSEAECERVVKHLIAILDNPLAEDRDRIAAAKALIMAHKLAAQAESRRSNAILEASFERIGDPRRELADRLGKLAARGVDIRGLIEGETAKRGGGALVRKDAG